MFKDYYKILEIDYPSNNIEIKKAFKIQALKFHPDKNIDINTTTIMQEITEAYIILKNKETKSRYDIEYVRFYQQKNQNNEPYNYHDSELEAYIKKILLNISKYTNEVRKETSELTTLGYKAAGNEMVLSAISMIVISLIISIFISFC